MEYRISVNSFRGFQKAYEGEIRCFCTVTFDQKVSKKNSFRGNYSRKYGMLIKMLQFDDFFFAYRIEKNSSQNLQQWFKIHDNYLMTTTAVGNLKSCLIL